MEEVLPKDPKEHLDEVKIFILENTIINGLLLKFID